MIAASLFAIVMIAMIVFLPQANIINLIMGCIAVVLYLLFFTLAYIWEKKETEEKADSIAHKNEERINILDKVIRKYISALEKDKVQTLINQYQEEIEKFNKEKERKWFRKYASTILTVVISAIVSAVMSGLVYVIGNLEDYANFIFNVIGINNVIIIGKRLFYILIDILVIYILYILFRETKRLVYIYIYVPSRRNKIMKYQEFVKELELLKMIKY